MLNQTVQIKKGDTIAYTTMVKDGAIGYQITNDELNNFYVLHSSPVIGTAMTVTASATNHNYPIQAIYFESKLIIKSILTKFYLYQLYY